MKIVVDTNVLVRALTDDDLEQSAVARAELERAEMVVLTTPTLCELVWVLSRSYRLSHSSIADALRSLVESETISADLGAFDAGIAHLEAGGDFADGAIAYEGRRMGAATFVSFDRKAVHLVASRGGAARSL